MADNFDEIITRILIGCITPKRVYAFLWSSDFVHFYKDKVEKYLTYQEKNAEQIEMSAAENIFGSVFNFLTPQTSSRPTFSFNIGLVG